MSASQPAVALPMDSAMREAFSRSILAALESFTAKHHGAMPLEQLTNHLVASLTCPVPEGLELEEPDSWYTDFPGNGVESGLVVDASDYQRLKSLYATRLCRMPSDVVALVQAAKPVVSWLDWSGGLPQLGGQSMDADVRSLRAAVNEFEHCEVMRQVGLALVNPMLPKSNTKDE